MVRKTNNKCRVFLPNMPRDGNDLAGVSKIRGKSGRVQNRISFPSNLKIKIFQVLGYVDNVKIDFDDLSFVSDDTKLKDDHIEGDEEAVKISIDFSKNSETARKKAKRMRCCDICGKQVSSSYFKRHMRSHPNETKLVTFFCDICKYSCNLKHRIRFHMRHKHLKVVQYKCEFCNRSYTDKVSLKFHTSNTHTQKFQHHCTICNKGLITAYRLRNHMALHSDLRQFKCDICGDSFKTDEYLKRHKRETHSGKVLSCGNCKKTFKNMKLLSQHQIFHKPNTYNCVLCEQTFAVGQTLRGHLKRNHPELPVALPGTKLKDLKDLDSYLALCI